MSDAELRYVDVTAMDDETRLKFALAAFSSRPLNKDLNRDRVIKSCVNCRHFSSSTPGATGIQPACAVNPIGNAETCPHFMPR